tara:strand:- start:162 stop:350 length:189 start_codon:yes stop_codon:yes gene_type:complete
LLNGTNLTIFNYSNNQIMLKCFFFDRDRVLIKDYGYVYKTKHLKWLNGAPKAIKFINKKKLK